MAKREELLPETSLQVRSSRTAHMLYYFVQVVMEMYFSFQQMQWDQMPPRHGELINVSNVRQSLFHPNPPYLYSGIRRSSIEAYIDVRVIEK